jgi:hypothetical protein
VITAHASAFVARPRARAIDLLFWIVSGLITAIASHQRLTSRHELHLSDRNVSVPLRPVGAQRVIVTVIGPPFRRFSAFCRARMSPTANRNSLELVVMWVT